MNYMAIPGMKQTRGKVRPMVAMKMDRDAVIRVVCNYFDVTIEDLRKVSRVRAVVYRRQVAMYFLVNFTNETYLEIGQLFGKDHTTVLYSKDLVRDQIELDDKVHADVNAIKIKLIEAYY